TRFAGGVGSAGGQFLDASNPRGFIGTFTLEPGSTTHWTARFTGLDATSLALAAGGNASITFDPYAVAAVDPPVRTTVEYVAGATPDPAGTCATPYAPNEATGGRRHTITGP